MVSGKLDALQRNRRVQAEREEGMRLIVDDLPRTSKECLFGWKHLEYSKWRCKFGGECELSAECRQCSHLVTFGTDNNVGTKYESYKEVTK